MTAIDVRANLAAVRERIADAARRAGRGDDAVLLVAVSKTVDVDRVRAAIAAGVPALGENRVQEAREKIAALGRPRPWHLIGHLQTNKVRDALDCFDLIHSVDRLPLAQALSSRAAQAGRRADVLVQVNVGEEPQKGGIRPEDLRAGLEAMAALPGLRLRGLMTIPPLPRDPEDSRPHYRQMSKLLEGARGWGLPGELTELSMGMSGDFEVGDRGGGDDRAGGHRDLRPPGDLTVSVRDKRFGFVGGGNMGEALVRGLTKTGLMPKGHLLMADVRSERLEEMKRLYGVVVTSDNVTLVRGADVVILAVKPQILGAVLDEIAPATPGKLLISVAAGVSTSEIRRHLPPGTRLIRVMPNTPALVLEGATAIARADGLADGDLDTARQIFEAVGRAVILDEEMMDAVTGLSGSGPAYIALVVEALADGGVRVGLDRKTAMTLAMQTVLGSARLLIDTGMHPGQLKDMVSSPGGTTIAGIHTLEIGGLRRTLIDAVERATQRSRELGQGR